jgi:chondroitin 4-sulfotransferase 11
MIICKEKNIIFVHIPKNSGTSMTDAIKEKYPLSIIRKGVDINTGYDKMHLYTDIIDKYINKIFLNNMKRFCIIRNPYEKFCSAYYNFRPRYIEKYSENSSYGNINKFIKMIDNDFIYGKQNNYYDPRVHYRPQYTFIYDNNCNNTIDIILRYENLNNDISELNKKYGLCIKKYGNEKKYKKLKYINELNKESINILNKLYKKDFELLNYKMITK